MLRRRDRVRVVVWAAIASAISSTSGAAHAAPSARLVYLRNAGAESCPDEEAVRTAVSARLGYDPFLAYAPTTLIAEVDKTDHGFSAHVKLVDEENTIRGNRNLEIDGDRCADIIDAMALTISIAIDPDSLTRPPPAPAPAPVAPPPTTPAPPAPAPAPAPPPSSAPVPAPPAPPPATRLSLVLTPELWLGAAPSASVGGNLAVDARRGALSLALEGRYDLPASRALDVATIETSTALASLVPCVHAHELAICAVGSLGSIFATSRGIASPRSDSALHALAGVRAAADVALSEAFFVRAQLDGRFALTPQSLDIDGIQVYSLPRWSAGAGIGVGWRFF